MKQFSGKVVIITGSSSGMGQATAVEFAKEGAKVTIHGQNTDRLKETEKMMIEAGAKPRDILIVSGSVEDEKVLKNLVDATLKNFSKIDVLVNNVGIAKKPGCDAVYSSESFDYIFNVNLKSVVNLTWLALPHLEKTQGNIINVSSIGSFKASPPAMYYTMAKAALDHFTRNMALVYGPKGVRINCVNPGAIETAFLARHGVPKEIQDKMFENSFVPFTPMRRIGTPSEIADVILFLASDKASYMTGSFIVVDGGKSLHNASSEIDPKLLNNFKF